MKPLDTKLMVRQVTERLNRTTNERHKKILAEVIEHMDAESDMDVDRLVNTVAKDAVYHNWAQGEDTPHVGQDAIANMYIGVLKAGLLILEFDIERLVVDDYCVVTEGYQRSIVPADWARNYGIECEDDDIFCHTFRQSVLWDFNEQCEMTGEIFYHSMGKSGLEKMNPTDVPEDYYRQFELAKSPALEGRGESIEQLIELN